MPAADRITARSAGWIRDSDGRVTVREPARTRLGGLDPTGQNPGMTTMRVVPFEPEAHLEQTVAVLLRVWAADSGYPPRRSARATPDSLKQWLEDDGVLQRFAATVDGTVAGHVLIAVPHHYLTRHLAGIGYEALAQGMAEIGKLFVDPLHQRLGIGAALLDAAVEGAWNAGRQPALAVLAPSTAARSLYKARGMLERGTFEGRDGVNHVFVDERLPSRPRGPLAEERSTGSR